MTMPFAGLFRRDRPRREVRPVLQTESTECGLACVAMIATWHGHAVGIAELRHRRPVSARGARLSQLLEVAGSLGLRTRAVRVELEALAHLQAPAILHWDLNHFVVLVDVRDGFAWIVDPARGEVRMPLSEVSRHFTGVAVEVQPDTEFVRRAPPPAASLRQLTGRVTGLRRAIVELLVLSMAVQCLVLVGPFFLQWVVDQVLLAQDRPLLLVLSAGFALLLVLQVAIGQLRGIALVHLSTRLGSTWTANVFSHVLRLPLGWFGKRNLADVTSRMASVQTIQKTLTTRFLEGLMDGALVVVTLAMMLVYSPWLALMSLVGTAIYFALRAFSYRRLRDAQQRQLEAAARQHGFALESLRGIQSLKLAGARHARTAHYQNLVVDTAAHDARIAGLQLAFVGGNQLVFGLERIAVVGVGALLAMENIFSVGMLVAYLAYREQFATRSAALVDKLIEFRMLRLHGERLADIVLTAPENEGGGDVPVSARVTPRIELEDVSFRYSEDDPWILRHCSGVIEPGESVAIVGPSGSGKTTLLKVLLGLLAPTEGRVLVDGVPLERFGVARFRQLIGSVMQEDQLFAGSIGENIAFFDLDAEPSRIEHAASLAAIHDEIARLPMGYDTLIGDMGNALSGGQKQRVLLARALYRSPGILVLDEATSHLDTEREGLVNRHVRELDVSRVIVAHRPSTIGSADRILRLDAGRLSQEHARPAVAPA